MTNDQIELLRDLIQSEIEYALANEAGDKWAFEQKERCDSAWAEFVSSFNQ